MNNTGIYFHPIAPSVFGESLFTNGIIDSYSYGIRMGGTGTIYSHRFSNLYVDAIGIAGFVSNPHTIAISLADCQFVGETHEEGAQSPQSIIKIVGGSDFVLSNVRVANMNTRNAAGGEALTIGADGVPTSDVVVVGGSYHLRSSKYQ